MEAATSLALVVGRALFVVVLQVFLIVVTRGEASVEQPVVHASTPIAARAARLERGIEPGALACERHRALLCGELWLRPGVGIDAVLGATAIGRAAWMGTRCSGREWLP